MKIFLFTVFAFIQFSSFSQIINTDIETYKNFKEGTTYFIKSGDTDFDQSLDILFDRYWTINNWSLISMDEVENLKGDNSFFLSIFEYSYDRSGVSLSYTIKKMFLSKDIKTKKKKTQPEGVICTSQIDEMTLPEFIYSIQMIQNQINFVFELNKKKSLGLKDMLEEISDRKKKRIQEKTLYFLPFDLKNRINSKEKLEEIYDYKYKFATKEDIETAIIEQNEDVVYAKIINYKNLRFVLFIQAKDSELLYGKAMAGFNQLSIGPKFIKDINE